MFNLVDQPEGLKWQSTDPQRLVGLEKEYMEDRKPILVASEAFVRKEFEEKISADLGYHNLDHTLETRAYAKEIGQGMELEEKDLEVIELACLFHDLGYCETYQDHEAVSAALGAKFLTDQEYDQEGIDKVIGCIQATKVPQSPKNILEEVVCDADLRTTSLEIFEERSRELRTEWKLFLNREVSDLKWWEEALTFLERHQFHTSFARDQYNPGKLKTIKRVKEIIGEISGEDQSKGTENPPPPKTKKKNNPNKKKKKNTKAVDQPDEFSGLSEKEIAQIIKKRFKEKTPERGVETMFRTSSRNHIQLSAIADNKANIMLSINAVIVSIIVSTLVPRLTEDPFLTFPTFVILTVCVLSIIFATLSTIPKVTQGTFTKKDIENKTANLLFFGNFHKMELPVFESGVKDMMADREFLYGAMTRDLYFLGRVLNKKYRFLRICYNVFMYGLILAVLSFIAAFLFRGSL